MACDQSHLSHAAPAACVSPKNHTGLHAAAHPALPGPPRPTLTSRLHGRPGDSRHSATPSVRPSGGWDRDRSTYQGPPGVYCPSHPVRPRAGPTGPPSTVEGWGGPAFVEPVRIQTHQNLFTLVSYSVKRSERLSRWWGHFPLWSLSCFDAPHFSTFRSVNSSSFD